MGFCSGGDDDEIFFFAIAVGGVSLMLISNALAKRHFF